MSFMRSLLALCALGLCSLAGHAQTTPAVSTIVAFSLSNPVGNVVKGPDGALYGTALPVTSIAGGLVWRSTADGSDVRTLYQFTADDAIAPGAGLTLASDSLLYGTTRFGKPADVTGTGTVFRIAPNGTGFQIIFRFAATTGSNELLSPKNTNGAYPESELTEGNDGYLYGVATAGGPEGTGAVFKLSKDGTDFQLLKSFGALIRTLTGFGGAEGTVVADPTNASNRVARVVKSATAELSAGVTVSTGANSTVGTIPFTATSTRMTVRVYSPRAGIPVRLKVEDAADSTRSVETEALTTLVNTWETLTFDFANQVAGTAALNLAYTYNKASIFFDYGKTGAAGGSGTFYFDDVLFDTSGGGGSSSFTPITFDSSTVTYTLTGFGGATAAVVADPDPTNAANIVARVVKSATAELSAGVTVSTAPNNTVGTIPFTATSTRMTARVYSPRAGIPVRLKVEDAADPTRSVETEALTTLVNTWETLTFDFANQVAGTAALNLAYTYNRLSIFFDYGKTGAAGGSGTFYFDDVLFDASGGGSSFEPITFALACGPTLTVDGAGPAGPLVLGDDGLFYGTTTTGGPDGCGAVFRIGFDGAGFQVLRHFSAATADATTGLPENADGATPIGGLIDGGDGVFYGTATQGGTEGRGVVYSITPAGVFNVLHVFNNANGSRPLAELLLGSDGKLYGTTTAGGVNSEGTTTSFGTIFSIGRDGTGFTRLYSFDGAQGSAPGSQLLQLSSGVFVGLTNSSGSCGYGTLFRYSQAGDTVDGNRRCGRSNNNNNGGGTAGLGLLALLGALALGRRRRHG
jgi:uncharacterized repeat protein (TIGR03803 family)